MQRHCLWLQMQLARWIEKRTVSRTKGEKNHACLRQRKRVSFYCLYMSDRERRRWRGSLLYGISPPQCVVTTEFAKLWIAQQTSICFLHAAHCEGEQRLIGTEPESCCREARRNGGNTPSGGDWRGFVLGLYRRWWCKGWMVDVHGSLFFFLIILPYPCFLTIYCI